LLLASALLDVLFGAPAFFAAPFVAVAGWTATFDAAWSKAQVVLDEASPHFGAIGRLR